MITMVFYFIVFMIALRAIIGVLHALWCTIKGAPEEIGKAGSKLGRTAGKLGTRMKNFLFPWKK